MNLGSHTEGPQAAGPFFFFLVKFERGVADVGNGSFLVGD
jgi:hypothetical protein